MKHWYRVVPALLLAALAACSSMPATQPSMSPTETPAATEEPAPISTPEPTPSPDPSAGLEYEMLTLPLTPQPPEIHDSLFMARDDTQTERSNGYAFIRALYTNDTEKLRETLSDSVLNSGLPLPDLTGMVITEVNLAGGEYEVPYATLTIADPGATGLPTGEQNFVFSFDEEGKVESFCMWDGDLKDYVAQGMGLEPGAWVALGSLDVTDEFQDDLNLTTETRVVGRKLDALGFKVGEVRAFSITEQKLYEEGSLTEYEMTSCQELPGDWPVPRGGEEVYSRIPEGNCLTKEELGKVSEKLNIRFTQLREGTYATEWESDPNQAALRIWDFGRPVPVEVTPEVLRSDILTFPNPDILPRTRVWVPLPEGCWAVCSLSGEGKISGFSFYLTVPEGV